ncbi:hypothetical protein EYF80_054358 [Liparis tanakae]|uniref:Uncharacterized protein n=1 Tax=Liparis tanakae TaxID=230148 RepID=A0A4Z2F2V9_9TELE|nr:hypothetical protein EYF80_054358 [Liparis tanakae]
MSGLVGFIPTATGDFKSRLTSIAVTFICPPPLLPSSSSSSSSCQRIFLYKVPPKLAKKYHPASRRGAEVGGVGSRQERLIKSSGVWPETHV